MKNQTFYKVVYCDRLTSDMYSTSTHSHALQYKIGKTTYPTIGKIFVFDTFNNAIDFFFNSTRYLILEGIGTNPVKPKLVCNSGSTFDVEQFWKTKKAKKAAFDSTLPLIGTIFVDSFTPTKIVKDKVG
jgi:hypothetical protein